MLENIGHLKLSVDQAQVAASVWQSADITQLRQWQSLGLNIAEIRLDLSPDMNVHQAKQFCQTVTAALPSILTIRSQKEGGQWHKTEEERLYYFQSLINACSAVDIELSSPTIIEPLIQCAHDAKRTVIISCHNFNASETVESMQNAMSLADRFGADIFKTASLCLNEGDYKELEEFTHQCKQNKRLSVIIGMSDNTDNISAIKARTHLPQQGSCIAFASKGENSAPGQLTIKQTVDALSPNQ